MSGSLSHELEINAPASKAWEIYGTLQLSKLVVEKLPQLLSGVEVVEGDGGVGTVLKLLPPPGAPFTYFKEKFVVVDDEKRVKVTEVVEGGLLEMGFTLYRFRLEVIEKGSDSCVIKSTVEYEVKEEAASIVPSVVSVEPMAAMAEITKEYLTNN